MTRFLLRRARWAAVTLFLVLATSFFLLRAVPGGPFDAERSLHPEVEAQLAREYHLDWPLWRQFLQYLGPFNWDAEGVLGTRERTFGGVLAGDLGPSLRHRDHGVAQILRAALPVSFQLGALALLWSVGAGLAAGALSALRPGGFWDLTVRAVSSVGVSLPNFSIASLCLVVFAFAWPLLPVAGLGGWQHMVLPAFALGAPNAAYVARLTRAGLLEALPKEFVRTATGKGLSRARIVGLHALREALLPVVAHLGPASAGLLTGSLVIEKIFFLPGAGTHFVNSALNRDYTLAMGVTLVYSVLVFTLNALADACAALLDPRIDLDG
jgi:oligopeptide transport system permease protein